MENLHVKKDSSRDLNENPLHSSLFESYLRANQLAPRFLQLHCWYLLNELFKNDISLDSFFDMQFSSEQIESLTASAHKSHGAYLSTKPEIKPEVFNSFLNGIFFQVQGILASLKQKYPELTNDILAKVCENIVDSSNSQEEKTIGKFLQRYREWFKSDDYQNIKKQGEGVLNDEVEEWRAILVEKIEAITRTTIQGSLD